MAYVEKPHQRRAGLRFWGAVIAATLLTGFGVLSAPAYAQNENAQNPQDRIIPLMPGEENIDPNQPLKPGFVVNVTVFGEPEPSGKYTIDEAGNVSIKYQNVVSAISVKGLTPKMAEGEVAKFLKTYIKNPQVTVTILSIPRPIVFVGGAVKTPGPMMIASDYTLMDILSRAQWLPEADLTQVRITRKEKVNGEEKAIAKIYNFDEYLRLRPGAAPDENQNPTLKDKDRIYISFKTSQGSGVISVGGEVTKPTQNIPLRTSPATTVREVINLVGGTTGQANRRAISIRRAGVDRPLIIDLDKADQGDLVNNIELRPDDAVYVERLENNAFINMTGGFVKQGKMVYDKRTTLLQAIAEAGGPAQFARVHEGKVFRHPDGDPKNTQVIQFNLRKIEKGQSPDIALQPGDTVYISPGTQPRPPITFDTALSTMTQAVWLYNMFNGNFFNQGFGR